MVSKICCTVEVDHLNNKQGAFSKLQILQKIVACSAGQDFL